MRILLVILAGILAARTSRAQEQPQPNVMTRPAATTKLERAGPLQQTAKIVMEDGTEPPAELQVKATGACVIHSILANGTVTYGWPAPPTGSEAGTPVRGANEEPERSDGSNVTAGGLRMPAGPLASAWRNVRPGGCTALITGPGVRSRHAWLTSKIVLKRLGPQEGSTVSLTTLQAPADAKKAYAKGEAALDKRKYADARKEFERATRLDGRYASAWSELGRTLVLMGKVDEARAALKESIGADGKYLKPVAQLVELEASAGRWAECVEAAESALRLNPVEYPGVYYYRALAHLRSSDWEHAVEMSQKTLEVDAQRDYPRAYVLLASALEKRGDRPGAAKVLRQYLTDGAKGDDAEKARAYLRRLEETP